MAIGKAPYKTNKMKRRREKNIESGEQVPSYLTLVTAFTDLESVQPAWHAE